MNKNFPAVILAGGLGTRIREETEFKPKPMIEIGGKPIIWHIMKHLSVYGINRFIVCVGYKGDVIRDYFLNYRSRNDDFTVTLGSNDEINFHSDHEESNWRVTVAETGALTNTGGRILEIEKYISGESFLCTYGDGVSDINIETLAKFHFDHKVISTVTAVRPTSRFGILEINSENLVEKFQEKPIGEGWVSGGYFMFQPEIFNYLSKDSILELEPLQKLAQIGELLAYRHTGFWQPMDTYRESAILNKIWETGHAPWGKIN
jgi:glucose-1-phosphate cytidylyltransferase